MPNYSLSLGFFYTDVPLVERFALARQAGFTAVEFFWPGDDADFAEIARAQRAAGVSVQLFNMDEGDYAKGERGFAANPLRRDVWRRQLETALALADAVGCPRINALTGDYLDEFMHAEQQECLVENLKWAAPLAAARGVELLLEPLNAVTHPTYVCQTTTDALDIMRLVDESNVRLQYDFFQVQRGEGDVVHRFRSLLPDISHIQIGDSPDRGAPGTGELNYAFILEQVDAAGFEGFVGLEYKTGGDESAALAWLPVDLRQ